MSSFHIINKFATLEEIYPSLFEISSNIEVLKCKSLMKDTTSFIGMLSASNIGSFSSDNLKLPRFVTLINLKLDLFQIISKNLKLKLIIKFEKGRGFSFNSIVRVNYIYDFYYYVYLMSVSDKLEQKFLFLFFVEILYTDFGRRTKIHYF